MSSWPSTQSYDDEKLHRPVNNVTKRYPTLPVIVHQLSKKSEIITEDRSYSFCLLQEHQSCFELYGQFGRILLLGPIDAAGSSADDTPTAIRAENSRHRPQCCLYGDRYGAILFDQRKKRIDLIDETQIEIGHCGWAISRRHIYGATSFRWVPPWIAAATNHRPSSSSSFSNWFDLQHFGPGQPMKFAAADAPCADGYVPQSEISLGKTRP